MIVKASVWWLAVLPAGASVAVLYSLAFPSGNSGPFLLGGLAWVLLGLVWLGRLVWRRDRWLWATPALALLLGVCAWLDLPVKAAFAAGEANLARQVETGRPARAGIYEIAKVERIEGSDMTRLRLAGTGGPYYEETGFLYAPSGVPTQAEGMNGFVYRPIKGAWYWYDIPTR
ncbi:hypothetical protein EDD29_7080 [Actinocorallia herbida]|uniref:Uncharacterized protein n=1 Tax=Actinocorallia herbida TaxID=58109 RepID=A0A3N1D795_9ACTN|nr:hypothetical protein [Actinocorallia herbida]ROO89390.1 hypothetical protein EDD29_7080 [Actinocorallia herbida]